MAVSNTAIRVFRHALSLDERRAKFEVHHFQRFTDEERYDELRWDLIRESTAATRMTAVAASADEMKLIKEHFARKTDVKEVWFAGCHCGECHSSCFSFSTHHTSRCTFVLPRR